MECNKDEARKAMYIAERKVSENDYNGAKRFVDKAQNLYPNLDGLKQVLMMINVYISAANRINGGGDADWYGILGVDPLADDEAVKKQHKNLALLLHPDKNKFKGAEGAFKLVSQAWCLLSDKVKRIAYDLKRKSKDTTTGMQKPPNPHKPASHSGNQNARGGVDPIAKASSNKPASGTPNPYKSASTNGNQNARDNVDPRAKATSTASHHGNQYAGGSVDPSTEGRSNKPPNGMPKPPNPYKSATSYWNQNGRGGVDPSAGTTSNKPPSGIPNPYKSATSYWNQNARDSVDPSGGATSNKHVPAPTDSSKQRNDSMWFWKKCNNCKVQSAYSDYNLNKALICPNCCQTFIATEKTQWPANLSSSPQPQQQWSTQNKGTKKSTNGASSFGRPSASVAQKPTQASARSRAANTKKNGAFSSGRVSASSVSATAKTPGASVVRPVNRSSFPTQQQQQCSAQNKATNKSTNVGASSGEVNSSPSVSTAQKTPQASAKSGATNKNTNGAFSAGRVYESSVSATVKTPLASVVTEVNRLQQWIAQYKATNKSTNVGASSGGTDFSPSVSAAQKTTQASAKTQAINKNTYVASASGRVSSRFASATAKTPGASVVKRSVKLSSSPQLQQQQQRSAQNTSGGTYSQRFSSSSLSYTTSVQWSCSVSVTANTSIQTAANQAQESSKRVHEKSQETVAAAEKVPKKPRTDVR